MFKAEYNFSFDNQEKTHAAFCVMNTNVGPDISEAVIYEELNLSLKVILQADTFK